jgi:hypothetical protein
MSAAEMLMLICILRAAEMPMLILRAAEMLMLILRAATWRCY